MAWLKIFKSYVKTPFLILLVVEVLVYFSAVFAAAYLRLYSEPNLMAELVGELWKQATIVAIVTPTAMFATGLYLGQIREGMAGVLLRMGISTAVSALVVSLIFYLIPSLILGRGILAIAYVLAFFVVGTIRATFLETVDSKVFKKRVLVYGAGKTASQIDRRLRRKSDRRGFDILGYVLLSGQNQEIEANKLIDPGSSLLDYSVQHGVNEIVVASSDMEDVIKVDDLVNCKLNGITVVDILSFFEREAGQVRIDIIDPSWLVTSDGFNQSLLRDFAKRTVDILGSLGMMIGTLPISLLTIISIWIEDGIGAPVFYSQLRVGRYGSHYKVYKFRSMRVDAEVNGEAVWASKGDNRITKTGNFIRKARIDELPQLMNVLLGTMSFVGPRPERPEFIGQLSVEIPYYQERHIVKPGVTGWAQLLYPYGSSVQDAYHKQMYDLYYVKNRSIFLDLLIILLTVEVVIFGKGAR